MGFLLFVILFEKVFKYIFIAVIIYYAIYFLAMSTALIANIVNYIKSKIEEKNRYSNNSYGNNVKRAVQLEGSIQKKNIINQFENRIIKQKVKSKNTEKKTKPVSKNIESTNKIVQKLENEVKKVTTEVKYTNNPKTNLKSKPLKKKVSPKIHFQLTDEFKEILDIINNTSKNIFITGKAGTGKSSLLKHFIKHTKKSYVVLAPTGIAALNVNGQTIHSFFRFPTTIIEPNQIKVDDKRANLYKAIDMIIIDEVSMVRSDLMNSIDISLRKNREKSEIAFGGVQMVFIGDLFQLPPILKAEDKKIINSNYGGEYFFNAPVFDKLEYKFYELSKIFRQSEKQVEFKKMLNNFRIGNVNTKDLILLNSYYRNNTNARKNSIFLTTRKSITRKINQQKLEKLPGLKNDYIGILTGDFVKKGKNYQNQKLTDMLPAPYILSLKKDAQVMMLKNDPDRRWVNGSIGKINKILDEEILVELNKKEYSIKKESWEKVKYVKNPKTEKIEKKVIGEFIQYPIRLSYAMTIHKSQGKTFEKIVIDIGEGAFAHGQIYVALSRCKTLGGIVLNNIIKKKDIIVDQRIIDFYDNNSEKKRKVIKKKSKKLSVRKVIQLAIEKKHDLMISYKSRNYEISKRRISDINISDDFENYGYTNEHINAFCHLRNEDRSFKISRILKADIFNKEKICE